MLLLDITNADISLILNVAFWCIIGMIAIFALVGAIKGFWKSVVGAVVQLILLVVVMFVTPGVANLIGNIDVLQVALLLLLEMWKFKSLLSER